MTAFRLFLSSVQREFAAERRAVKTFVDGDPLLRRFFSVFLFEDLAARDRRPDAAYLVEVDRCDAYVGLFGRDYGFEDTAGVSPTEHEFDRATTHGRPRLIFVTGSDDGRHAKMQALIRKTGTQVTRKRFNAIDDLKRELQASLVEFLEDRGAIQGRPFEDRPGAGASLEDIDPEAVARFVRTARHERQFALREGTPGRDVLAHLNLLHGEIPTQAGLLLFGRAPQRFVAAGEVRCMHFHGTEVQRPAPSYQVFKGTLFEQVDRAADFVLSVLTRGVGTRAQGAQAPVDYEIPPDVVREAIVNAVAHRDYTSGGAVQVAVFADRFEVSNHGMLPPPLTPESLSRPHNSIARHPRICEALFLARYIEKFGTGTLMMIRESAEHALPAPEFAQRGGEFVTTVWRDWLTGRKLPTLGLNARQEKAIRHLLDSGQVILSNPPYRKLLGVSKPTATRDLEDLRQRGVVSKVGTTGKGTHYVLNKGLTKGSMGSGQDHAGPTTRSGSKDKGLAMDSKGSGPHGPIESKTTQMTHGRRAIESKGIIKRKMEPARSGRKRQSKKTSPSGSRRGSKTAGPKSKTRKP